MPAVDVLCLAFSMKHGGRCVAGVRLDSGDWVRPVSAAEDGTLMPAACLLDVGRPIRRLMLYDCRWWSLVRRLISRRTGLSRPSRGG